ncbi:acyltransferase [Cellulomonas sp. ES6]|uniref:acyltransferase family protein n=1 Tax=Cellulomonas sp. ES6 TaxID=3039384 RepID=UPI0024B788CC|nr:acyltransferase [Cellulomonas sp. ES6]WHP17185.1 acyltransferase [Cellulomonas sp. ES6]
MTTTAPARSHLPATADPSPAAPGRGPRLAALDGLRFLAAVGVLAYHFTTRQTDAWGRDLAEVAPAVSSWAVYASLGPELFFVISGFVILMTAWGRSVPDIVGSRVGRLYPAYWVAVLATGALLLLIWPGKEVTGDQVLVNLTLLQSLVDVNHVDGVYWTLWVELRFYLLIALLAAFGITRRRVLWFAALWPAAALLARVAGLTDAVVWLVAPYAPLFAAGMVLYVIHRTGHALVPWLLVAGNAALATAALVPARMASLGENSVVAPRPALLTASLLGCVGLVALVSLTPAARWRWAGLTAAGALTYPLYLTHEYWGLWVVHLLSGRVPVWVVLAAATALSLVLAWLVHRFVEKPFGPRLRRATTVACERLRDRAVAAAAAVRARYEPGTPPTTPGGREPSRMPAKNAGV